MKLELKHIAPYLQYNIKVKYDEGLHYNTPPYSIIDGLDVEGVRVEGIELWVLFQNIKPILRPLSDLTREIEYNGERFVPNLHKDFKIFIAADMEYFLSNIEFAPFFQIQHLFKWHFDVFGLIPAGLAIDINTIDQ